ncbi:glycoside hydrolase family 5 protein [Microthyrium microscopicum]|uniref:Endoglucanase EG-II n=1 Tax=Microthyrium microscopicum TaxID=703497 RepID=A0A6A6U8Y3_9PEZI|nr:glycoside hydrolase family 5 protein [Microthyrium microscopicum]
MVPTAPPAPAAGKVAFAGMNIAGFDFGIDTMGNANLASIYDVASKGSGIMQMAHFVKDDGLNAFRLPVSWQYLVNNNLGGPLNPTNFAAYDKLVQGCKASGAKMCIVDIHNYARYNGKVIAQEAGGPTNEQYTSLLSQLAMKYKGNMQVAFDIMNEPHDLPNFQTWVGTCQAAVTAIRNAGAKNVILLPGTDYASATTFAMKSGPALLSVKNPDGSADGLIFNVHQYLDWNSSGQNVQCVKNNIDLAFAPLAAFLRQNRRQAMVTETGGSADPSCLALLCQQNDFINQNSDVIIGVVSWAAGGFDQSYVLTETPIGNPDGSWTDQPIVQQCIVQRFRGVTGQP